MVGYFLLLTMVLPSIPTNEPGWVGVESYAEYSVDDGDVMNGTYAWRILAVENSWGRNMVTLNETFEGATHWTHAGVWPTAQEDMIPPTGKSTELIAASGVVGDQILWLTRYINQILRDRTFIIGIPGQAWLVTGEEEMPFQEQIRHTLHLEGTGLRTADVDEATGILMRYSWTWPRLGTVHVTLKSTNVFASTVGGPNLFLDMLAIAPLFVLPAAGTAKGLVVIRNRGFGFSRLSG